MALSAAAIGAIGLGSLIYSTLSSTNKKRIDKRMYESNVSDFMKNSRKKKVCLYFDRNDELVDESVARADSKNFYHKYHIVEVELGEIDEEEGHEILTKGIFKGKNTEDNAKIFIDNLAKLKLKQYKKKLI